MQKVEGSSPFSRSQKPSKSGGFFVPDSHWQFRVKVGHQSWASNRQADPQRESPVTVADLDDAWRHTALRLGASRERIEVLRHQPPPNLLPVQPGHVLRARRRDRHQVSAALPLQTCRRDAAAAAQGGDRQVTIPRHDQKLLSLAAQGGCKMDGVIAAE